MATLSAMRIEVSDESVEVRLAPWQKVLGLLGNIRVARDELSDVRVVEDPVRDAMCSWHQSRPASAVAVLRRPHHPSG